MTIKLLLAFTTSLVLLPACQADNNRVLSVTKEQPMQPPRTSSYSTDYLMGKFDPAKTELFAKIPKKYADRSGLYLRQEALNAFIKMHTAAKKAGVNLTIRSATRNFDYQKGIWERKWLGKRKLSDGTNIAKMKKPVDKALKILEFSAMPGTSRHHWGTDIDLNSFNNKWFKSGKGLALFNWLDTYAVKYGFCRPYTAGRAQGYQEEKWHWSYMPLSVPMTQVAQRDLHDGLITGFLGSETAPQIAVVKNYILGISKKCR